MLVMREHSYFHDVVLQRHDTLKRFSPLILNFEFETGRKSSDFSCVLPRTSHEDYTNNTHQ